MNPKTEGLSEVEALAILTLVTGSKAALTSWKLERSHVCWVTEQRVCCDSQGHESNLSEISLAEVFRANATQVYTRGGKKFVEMSEHPKRELGGLTMMDDLQEVYESG